jgi:uncharacterized protein
MIKKIAILTALQLLTFSSVDGLGCWKEVTTHLRSHVASLNFNDKTSFLSSLPREIVNHYLLRYLLEQYRIYSLPPLNLAADVGFEELVEILIKEKDTDLNFFNWELACETPLVCAARNGHHTIVKMLLAAGADNNSPFTNGTTPLLEAVERDHADIVDTLLAAAVNPNRAGNHGDAEAVVTPLCLGARKGNLRIVLALLAAGAQADDAVDRGETALFSAAQKGHLSVVQRLLQAGAEVNHETHDGWMPLLVAAAEGHEAIIQILFPLVDKDKALFFGAQNGVTQLIDPLLKAGAVVNPEGGRETPLVVAAKNGHSEIMQLLLNAGADAGRGAPLVGPVARRNAELVSLLLAAHANVNRATPDGWTPLLIASLNGDDVIVSLLIAADAEVNKAKNYGYDPWTYHHCKLNDMQFSSHSAGLTPLIAATVGNHYQTVQHLLTAGARIDDKDDRGLTALYYAAENGSTESLRVLLHAGANQHRTTDYEFAYKCSISGSELSIYRDDCSHYLKKSPGFTPLTCVIAILKELNLCSIALSAGDSRTSTGTYGTPL